MSKVTSAGVAPLYSLRQHDKKHHCFEEAVVLGDEGRFDSLHFLNDTAIVTETQLASDTHIPVISKGDFFFFVPSKTKIHTGAHIGRVSSERWNHVVIK